jgi:predicted HTH domain antitoxin
MVTLLKQGATKKNIKKVLDGISREREMVGVDTYKYCGKISLNRDALIIQKELRDEWA